MINTAQRELIDATRKYPSTCGIDEDHTVAAGILTDKGNAIFGLNTYHYLGSPCAEVTVLSNLAAQSSARA